MKAVRIVELGGPVADRSVPVPACTFGEVLVEVQAAGVCHSDEHYRSGKAPPGYLPITPGHEVAGTITAIGEGVDPARIGERVAIHYLKTCGKCVHCAGGNEQFCPAAVMIGKYTEGGWAEYITVPSRNAVALPESITFEAGAVMMCSTATSFHALRKARLRAGERVAIFGAGGLGQSAVQLAILMGAVEVFAVDLSPERLETAKALGAVPIDVAAGNPVAQIAEATHGAGVDVALELIGLRTTIEQAVSSLAIKGRAAVAGICTEPVSVDTYGVLVGREAELIGVSDHLLSEIYELLDFAKRGKLRYDHIITERLPLEADRINTALRRLGNHGSGVRSVIVP